MRIIVDPDLCDGNAVCIEAAPETFEFGEDDKVFIPEPQLGSEDVERVLRVIKMCPRRALSVE